MSEIYNRTMLYSGANAVSACNLSEPITNFQYAQFLMKNGLSYLVPTRSATTIQKLEAWDYWNADHYFCRQFVTRIANAGKLVELTNYQILLQNGTATPRLFGSSNNRSGNILYLKSVWGLNRVSGTPTSAIGVPITGAGWKPYNETFLASGLNVSSLTLSEPATAFERIRLLVGRSGESLNSYECAAPSGDGSGAYIAPRSYWGNATSVNGMVFTKYAWLSGTKVLSSVGGKSFQFGWNSANPFTGTGSTANADYRWRPIYAVYGINRK